MRTGIGRCAAAFWVGVLVLAGAPAANAAFEIVSAGRPRATVVLPADASREVRDAGHWVVEYVERATGAKLPLVAEGEPAEGNLIAVGHTRMAQEAGISVEGIEYDGGRMAVRGNALFLLGHDQEDLPGVHRSLRAFGTNMTVVRFLENHLDVLWIVPGPEGAYVPETRDFSVPADLDFTYRPNFVFARRRTLWPIGSPGSFASNFRVSARLQILPHTWGRHVPASQYGETNPEYFYFDGEKRHPIERNHLCTTNPEVKEIMLREMRRTLDAGYDWVSLAQSDGFRRCQCDECEALDNYRGWRGLGDREWFFGEFRENPAERIHLMHKAIIDELAESHPDKKVLLLVYGPTSWPSNRFDRYGDNVIAYVCHYPEQLLPTWAPLVAGQTRYVYFWGVYKPVGVAPKFTPYEVAPELKLYHRHNVIGVTYDGGGESWGLDGPAYYTASRLMTDPSLDVETILDEYCNGLYGAAAPQMRRFFNAVFAVVQASVRGRVDPDVTQEEFIAGLGNEALPNTAEARYADGYPPEVQERLDVLLKAAEVAADTERARMWVKLSRDQLDYVFAMARMYQAYRVYKEQPGADNFFAVKAAHEAWGAQRDKILGYDEEYVEKWFPGHNQWVSYFPGRRFRQHIHEPVTWDWEAKERQYRQ